MLVVDRKPLMSDEVRAEVRPVAPRLPSVSETTIAWLVLALFPLWLVVIDHDWILPRPDSVDPWIFVSHFLDPAGQAVAFSHRYHAGRLPIILPGAFFCQFLRLDFAMLALHLSLYYVSTFALFGTLSTLLDRRTALLTTVLAGGHAMFLSTMGLGHADAFGVTYALATIFLLSRAAAGSGWFLPLIAAGATSALFAFTNIGYLPLMAAFVWLFFALPRGRANSPCGSSAGGRDNASCPWHGFAEHTHSSATSKTRAKSNLVGIGAAILGFAMVTAALAAINDAFGGPAFFFQSSVLYAHAAVGLNQGCWTSDGHWLTHSVWLVAPAATLLASLAAWRLGSPTKPYEWRVFRALIGAFAVTVGVMSLAEFSHLLHYFRFSFYTSLALPAMFLAWGVLLAPFVRTWSSFSFWSAIAVAFAAALLTVASFRGGEITLLRLWGYPVAILAVGILMLARPEWLREQAAAVTIGCFAFANFLIADSFERFLNECPLERRHLRGQSFVGEWRDPLRDILTERPPLTRANACRIVENAYRFLASEAPNARIWYSAQGPYGSLFTAIASTKYWDCRFVSHTFPKMLDVPGYSTLKPERIALLTTDGPAAVAEAGDVARRFGLDAIFSAGRSFTTDYRIPAAIAVVDLVPIVREGPGPRERP